eukprot:5278395-Pleurochrysis_carterae.AAC.3
MAPARISSWHSFFGRCVRLSHAGRASCISRSGGPPSGRHAARSKSHSASEVSSLMSVCRLIYHHGALFASPLPPSSYVARIRPSPGPDLRPV